VIARAHSQGPNRALQWCGIVRLSVEAGEDQNPPNDAGSESSVTFGCFQPNFTDFMAEALAPVVPGDGG